MNHPQEEKVRWELRSIIADVVYKWGILVAGAIVAALFVFLQDRQAESLRYASLMSERESADTKLRSEMFKTLVDAYFLAKMKSEGKADQASSDPLKALRQEVFLSDLLSRNFESIDIRPVFEDLNERLSKAIYPDGPPIDGQPIETGPTHAQHQTFKQREELRRVAIGATGRQTAALEALDGDRKARVSYQKVLVPCLPPKESDGRGQISPALPNEFASVFQYQVEDVKDGNVMLRLWREEKQGEKNFWKNFWKPQSKQADEKAVPAGSGVVRHLTISFFDMPVLENIYLGTGERVAFSLFYYLSRDMCRLSRFRGDLDGQLQLNCIDVDEGELCALAQLRTVILPKDFVGLHDRPFVNDIAANKFRDPWYKIW